MPLLWIDNREMKIQIIILSMAFSLPLIPTFGQEFSDTLKYEIKTSDGNLYLGKIIHSDAAYIQLLTDNIGEIKLLRANIKSVIVLKSEHFNQGEYWSENLQASRYFFQPNGYGLKQGEAYYQNIWVLWNQVSFGLSKNFSVGLGVVPLFLFGSEISPVWLTPKISIKAKENLNLGIGSLIGYFDGNGYGIAYGVTTFGSKDTNCSLGLGYGYAGGGWADLPTFTFSAMARTGPKGYIITENYYLGAVDSNLGLLSIGGRTMLQKVGIDYAAVFPINTGSFFLIPVIGFTVPIGDQPGNLTPSPY
jgi:hypothetical protein